MLQGPITGYIRLLVAAFFRQVEVVGTQHVPPEGGGIYVSWHPNALVDPGLIFATSPRRVIFGARHGLFKWPGLGLLMRAVGTVPIYRAEDTADASPEARRAANQRSLDTLAQAVASGELTCLFPEGTSHDQPFLLALRSGVARFYYRARQLRREFEPMPVILPVGLHYDAKWRFRSSALVSYHPPLVLPPDLDVTPGEDEPEDVSRERNRRLTEVLEGALRDVVHSTESWELHHLMHRAATLLQAERARRAGTAVGATSMHQRQLGFRRIWAVYYYAVDTAPEEARTLVTRLREYDADLRALWMEDTELDRAPRSGTVLGAALTVGQVAVVYLLMPSLIVLGGVINIGPFLALRAITALLSRYDKDVATLHVLIGALLYPLAWATAAAIAFFTASRLHEWYPMVPGTPGFAALVVAAVACGGGMLTLHYLRLTRETARAVRVRLTRARQRMALANLRVEREELAQHIDAMEARLDPPGSVTAEGLVVDSDLVPPGGRA